MSKVTLEFNLPQETNDYETALNGNNMACVLWDLDQWLKETKNREVRDKLHELMLENNLDFNSIIFA